MTQLHHRQGATDHPMEHEHILEAVQRRLDEHPEKMRQRRETVEHPFGTIKTRMGAIYFLMKALPGGCQRDGAPIAITCRKGHLRPKRPQLRCRGAAVRPAPIANFVSSCAVMHPRKRALKPSYGASIRVVKEPSPTVATSLYLVIGILTGRHGRELPSLASHKALEKRSRYRWHTTKGYARITNRPEAGVR
jgi:hypothetical protein